MRYNAIGNIPARFGLEIVDMARPLPPFDLDDARRSYLEGESLLSLSKRLGISRGALAHHLDVPLRNGSEANVIRMAREGEDGRRKLVEAAHKARTGSKASLEEKLNRANARGNNRGHGEAELLAALQPVPTDAERMFWPTPESQYPCGVYNIDIAVRTVAVELMKLPVSGRLNSPAFLERAKYLRNEGYCVIIVLFKSVEMLLGSLDHIVAFIERADCEPAVHGKDWMIRCGAEFSSTRGLQNHERAGKITPVRFFHTVSEWYP
jgi:hypothetical protein